ncbi:uncharacterized protein (TIGR00730 family) [Streptacidiphilus sp. MAP12-20]|uniref:LOG family protein n=1 Tax=Streptacidiphilus sp. MAP12-20 TaxID=3156299 RepID=UPI0035161B34
MSTGDRSTRVGVFCGARSGSSPGYLEAAHGLGLAIARRGLGLVYGAGGVGLMGAVSEAAQLGGAPVYGVIPEELHERERLDAALGDIVLVDGMHSRKAMFYELADAFVVLPGGYGTLDELMEISTWNQLGFHRRKVVLLNVENFFEPLLAMLDRMVSAGFLAPDDRKLIAVADDPETALDALGCAEPAQESGRLPGYAERAVRAAAG